MEIGNCRYLSDTAQELEIFLLEIREIDRFGQFRTLPNVGLNLCWSWGTDTLFTHILPGGKKFFNLGHVVHPDERLNHPLLLKAPETRNKAFFTLASFPRNPGYEGAFEAKTYRLHLLIGGKNVRPKRYWVRFDFQNEWTRDVDDMCRSLSLKIE